MTSYHNDLKSPDSEAGNPCLSLFGEDSGSNRTVIAGWQKDVSNQASPSNVTDLELLENFNGLSTDVATCWRRVLSNKRIFIIITMYLKKECEGGESAAGLPADSAAATLETRETNNSQMKTKLKFIDILYNFINNFIYLKHKDLIFQKFYHYG